MAIDTSIDSALFGGPAGSLFGQSGLLAGAVTQQTAADTSVPGTQIGQANG
mgnify:CR=1 FL=1